MLKLQDVKVLQSSTMGPIVFLVAPTGAPFIKLRHQINVKKGDNKL